MALHSPPASALPVLIVRRRSPYSPLSRANESRASSESVAGVKLLLSCGNLPGQQRLPFLRPSAYVYVAWDASLCFLDGCCRITRLLPPRCWMPAESRSSNCRDAAINDRFVGNDAVYSADFLATFLLAKWPMERE